MEPSQRYSTCTSVVFCFISIGNFINIVPLLIYCIAGGVNFRCFHRVMPKRKNYTLDILSSSMVSVGGTHRSLYLPFTCTCTGTCSYAPCFLLQRRGELENHSVDAASTSEAVGFITLMQELKRQVRSWEQKVEVSHT